MGISGNLVYQKLKQDPPDIGPTTGHKVIATQKIKCFVKFYISSIYRRRSSPMLIIFDQPLFELITLLLCAQSLLFKVETYSSRTGAYCYGVKTYYNQQ